MIAIGFESIPMKITLSRFSKEFKSAAEWLNYVFVLWIMELRKQFWFIYVAKKIQKKPESGFFLNFENYFNYHISSTEETNKFFFFKLGHYFTFFFVIIAIG